MPKNVIILANGEYYHIYNRGVDKRDVYLGKQDYWKFFDCLRDLNNKTSYEERLMALGVSKNSMRELKSDDFKQLGSFLKEKENIVDVVSYSMNPNHFHLILKQLQDGGISDFMQKVGTSYTNCFNKKYDRSGALFQGTYKIVHIDTNDYLLWLLGYVVGNIEIHGLGKAENYPWSSYQAICKELNSLQVSELSALSGMDIVLEQFKSPQQFEEYVKQVIKESKTKKEMRRYLLESF